VQSIRRVNRGRSAINQKNQRREKCNAIKLFKRGRSAINQKNQKEGEVQCNQTNQEGEKCNAIRRTKREGRNQIVSTRLTKQPNVRTRLTKHPNWIIKRGEETKLWALDSPNNQSVSTRLTEQPKCEHLTHQTNKPICEDYLDTPNNQTNWTKRIQIKPNWTKRTMQRQIDEPIRTTVNQDKQKNQDEPYQTRQIEPKQPEAYINELPINQTQAQRNTQSLKINPQTKN